MICTDLFRVRKEIEDSFRENKQRSDRYVCAIVITYPPTQPPSSFHCTLKPTMKPTTKPKWNQWQNQRQNQRRIQRETNNETNDDNHRQRMVSITAAMTMTRRRIPPPFTKQQLNNDKNRRSGRSDRILDPHHSHHHHFHDEGGVAVKFVCPLFSILRDTHWSEVSRLWLNYVFGRPKNDLNNDLNPLFLKRYFTD